MIATNAGQDAVAACFAHGVRGRSGRSSRVVLSPRRWGLSPGSRARGDGGYQARYPGEITEQPFHHRAGNAGCFGDLW